MASKPRITKAYTLGFAAAVTLVCSILLASAATLLKDRQDLNIQLDIKYNILSVLGLVESHDLNPEQLLALYDKNVNSFVVDLKGKLVKDRKAETINPKDDPDLLPVFTREADGKVLAYCLPTQGKALWSTVKGYIALENDLNTVKGITFYSHGETPGLGGEIEKPWFTDNFKGKTILDAQGEIVSVQIVKGKIRDDAKNIEHSVDGISGATLTGKGINHFLKATLEKYEPYFETVRGVQS
ncbi:MAG: NADH:ubiquinone reductase (Na(+)-transporting) subunit C [Candidatus Marinimicrobia bacterium]|nr:NADH:ubiquinone reductase (Na(+)-transporting) subunit C [Candidatus Neomarinimicrobiota bacterium]